MDNGELEETPRSGDNNRAERDTAFNLQFSILHSQFCTGGGNTDARQPAHGSSTAHAGQIPLVRLEIFSDHEVLEMLLYFAVRQGDTNPTAHRLMQRFVHCMRCSRQPRTSCRRSKASVRARRSCCTCALPCFTVIRRMWRKWSSLPTN